MSLSPGSRLGVYEIVSLIGHGGMGEVYRARDTRLARDVALKMPRAGDATDPAWRARFQCEARVLASSRAIEPFRCKVAFSVSRPVIVTR